MPGVQVSSTDNADGTRTEVWRSSIPRRLGSETVWPGEIHDAVAERSISFLKLDTLIAVSLALAGFAFTAEAKPLKVYILAGQSNMDGQADIKTIDFLGEDKDPAPAALLKKFKPDGKTLVTRDDVWVANGGVFDKLQPGFGGRKDCDKLGSNIGPQFAFGYFMGEALEEPGSGIYKVCGRYSARKD